MCNLIRYWKSKIYGSIWENSQGYKVKILDYGENYVWVCYVDNKNKVSWEMDKFLKEYKPTYWEKE